MSIGHVRKRLVKTAGRFRKGSASKNRPLSVILGADLRRIVSQAIALAFLGGLAFAFLVPIISMIAKSFMTEPQIVDPTVRWIPKQFVVANYSQAARFLNLQRSLPLTVAVAVIPSFLQVVSCSLVSRFARLGVPFKESCSRWYC